MKLQIDNVNYHGYRFSVSSLQAYIPIENAKLEYAWLWLSILGEESTLTFSETDAVDSSKSTLDFGIVESGW